MFLDRTDAGRKLADEFERYAGRNVLVLALPRGGVVTGAEIARRLGAPLDVLIIRKIGHPWQPELAAGAVSETGVRVINDDIVRSPGVTEKYLEAETARQKEEIARRQQLYRGGRRAPSPAGRIVILVDDGVATGATLKAAIAMLKEEKPEKLIVAVPVAPAPVLHELETMADAVVCLDSPLDFTSVGGSYRDFRQVTDEEVVDILADFGSGSGVAPDRPAG